MKKIFIIAFIVVGLIGCSSKNDVASTLTLENFIKAYTDNGVEIDPNKKQMFEMVGASDGVIFYWDSNPVKIYEYKNKTDLEKAKKEIDIFKEYPSNENFLLETNNNKAIEVFKNVK